MIAKRYGLMTVGAFLMAFSVVVYFNPLELVTVGVTGLAILLEHLFHIPLWLVNAAVNIPLFIIGYKVLGKLIFYRTVYATVCLSVFLGLIRPLPLLTGDVLVDGLCGGVIMGGGLGLIFLQNASSGGYDSTDHQSAYSACIRSKADGNRGWHHYSVRNRRVWASQWNLCTDCPVCHDKGL